MRDMAPRPCAACLAALLLLFSPAVAALAEPAAGPAAGLSAVPLVETEVPVTYAVPGSVVSDGRIDVSSRVVGFIQQLDVREGQKVSRGDLLVRIDPSDIDEAIRQAEAGVRASREDLDDARADVEKYSKLAATGTIAAETLRKAKMRVNVSQAGLDKAQAALAAARAQKGYAAITSPVDGVVVSVMRRTGEMATAGAPLLTVESREVLLFKAFVAESRLTQIDPKAEVRVRIDTLKGKVFPGRVRGIVPSGDDITRRYEINVILPADPALVPGMFGRADFTLGTRKALLVPRAAIVHRGGLDGVFVLDGGSARFRWLRTGKESDDAVEVNAGLTAGETILLGATDALRDGASVNVVLGAQ
ncbi:efflux RND transporter periplasmic adaptor subunit [Xanthobacter autotrophicus]|uniref:efflux RND transporter periplasmic adaptor subunit n=1 Tax=Xanthobacter autotrophicus TaxID=280 RepID=UPI00372A3DB9